MKLKWWHTIEMPNGSIIKGRQDYRGAKGDRYMLPKTLTGKTVLDLGCYDGFFAIEAKKRGAEVTAADQQEHPRETAKIALGAYNIPYICSGNLDYPFSTNDKYDVVLFYGILYHLKNPIMGLFNAASCCKSGGIVIVESACGGGKAKHLPPNIPAMWIIDEVHNNDPTNHCMPNELGIKALCRKAGLTPQTPQSTRVGPRYTVLCKKD